MHGLHNPENKLLPLCFPPMLTVHFTKWTAESAYSVDRRRELQLKMSMLPYRGSIKGASLLPYPYQRLHGI